MTRAFQPGQPRGWALYRNGEVTAKGYHDLDALAVELPAPAVSPEAPQVKPLGAATETN